MVLWQATWHKRYKGYITFEIRYMSDQSQTINTLEKLTQLLSQNHITNVKGLPFIGTKTDEYDLAVQRVWSACPLSGH